MVVLCLNKERVQRLSADDRIRIHVDIMNTKIEKIVKLLKELIVDEKSMQIRINLHEGNLSDKVEVKENIYLEKKNKYNIPK